MKLLVASCLFTANPVVSRVYKAPRHCGWDCIFFSNSRTVGQIAARAGWQYHPLYAPSTGSELTYALASKQVKFLGFLGDQFTREESCFGSYTHVIYHDHKILLAAEHVRALLALMEANPDKQIFNFQTPRQKDSLFAEVAAAQHQHRYLENMGSTLQFIGDLLMSDSATSKDCITRTGVLAYRVTPEVRYVTRIIQSACSTFQQPECQILWSLMTQRHRDLIHTETWDTPAWNPPLWQAPETSRPDLSHGVEGLEEIALHSGEKIITFSDDLITTQIRRWGGHTRPEYAFATSRLKPGSRVFDLGAHIGTFTLAAARAVHSRGLVLAVEGNPTIYRLLRDNLNACGSAIGINCYVGSGKESVGIDDTAAALVSGNSMATKAVLVATEDPEGSPIAKTRSVDELVALFFAPDLIKLDLEGREGKAIMTSSFIKDSRPDLYFEVCDEHQRHFGGSVRELMNYLVALGYRFFTNIGERNAAHDVYVCGEVESPANYSEFWDVYCSTVPFE